MAKVATGLVIFMLCACGGGRSGIEYGDPIANTPPGMEAGGAVPATGAVLSTGGFVTTGGYFVTGGVRSGGSLPLTGGFPTTGGWITTGGMSTGGIRTGGFPVTGGIRTGGFPVTGGNRTGGIQTGGVRTGGLPATGGLPITGGIPTTGGVQTGGVPTTGGIPITGGIPTTGGVQTGGVPTTGGIPITGGIPGTGGIQTGGIPNTGGIPGTGGIWTGGFVMGGNIPVGGFVMGGNIPVGGFVMGGSIPVGGFVMGGNIPVGGAPALCGNGQLEPPETCDMGSLNYTRPAFLVTQGMFSFQPTPVVRVASATDFYNPVSESAHTGFEAANSSRIFLYAEKSTGELSLFFIHGIDADTSGQSTGDGVVTMRISNLPPTASVAFSDDDNELAMASATTAQGNWAFTDNTDGGVISGLSLPGGWEIMVSPAFLRGIISWTWIHGNGLYQRLALDQPITIEANDQPGQCRSDCTVPRCGDGILDGGEWCDDGNTISGDGCAADCKSFR